MSIPFPVWQFRVSRWLGRLVTHSAALLTLERIPPFVSASALVTDGDRILMVQDPIRREPVLPGGHLMWREAPLQAVVREVREETGYIIQPQRLVGVVSGEEWTGDPGIVRVIYEATIVGGAIASSAEGEATWLPISTCLRTASRDAPIVQRWKEKRTLDDLEA